ncbi:MAG: Ryanodine receptor Ryr [Alistipes sp.]|nr:Ryanodine receptor Ryr [Alistipes sp.]
MDNRVYTPSPIDTTDVVLPSELDGLVEVIAKNVHEVWAQGRLAEGWRYGTERDDAKRLTPCLVEYEELTEQEREYDRHTAIGTLKLITKLGFKIVPPGE